MATTSTKFIELADLHRKGRAAVLATKLMMVANDLATANEAMARHKDAQSADSDRDWGAALYFLRLQVSHLFEGMAVVKEVSECPEMLAVLRRCDRQTRDAFEELLEYLPDGKHASRFNDLVVRVRNNFTFHYDDSGKVIARSLADLASNSSRPYAKLTRGDHMFRWRFNVADRVIDNAICRDMWQIPHGAPLREEANENAEFVFKAFLLFLDFAGEFLWKFFSTD